MVGLETARKREMGLGAHQPAPYNHNGCLVIDRRGDELCLLVRLEDGASAPNILVPSIQDPLV